MARENVSDEEQRSFHGFGVADEETWEQWYHFVNQLVSPEDESDDGKETT